jgi:hypothetical protein
MDIRYRLLLSLDLIEPNVFNHQAVSKRSTLSQGNL